MSFSRIYSLYLDADSGSAAALLRSLADTTSAGPITWVAGDNFSFRLYLARKNGGGLTGATTLQIAGGDQLVISGKPASNPGSDTLLFSASGFTEVHDGDDYYYAVALDLNKTELINAIEATGTGQLNVLVTVQEENVDNTSRFSFQFVVNARASGYTGTESASTEGDLPYPAPDVLLTTGADTATIKRGTSTVANAAASKAIAFATAFATAPSLVQAWLMVPSGGQLIECAVDWSTITSAGFTAQLGAATPNGNYKLSWLALV